LGGLSKTGDFGLFENKLYGSIPWRIGKIWYKLKELVLGQQRAWWREIPKEFGHLSAALKVLPNSK